MNLVPLNINSISINESRLNMGEGNKGHAWALLPLVLFISLFLGIGIATGDFSNMPLNVAITITVIVALLMNRKETFYKKEAKKCIQKWVGIKLILILLKYSNLKRTNCSHQN